jgi:hypothetical protein
MARFMEHESFDESDVYAVPEMGIYRGWMALENSTPFHRSNSKDWSYLRGIPLKSMLKAHIKGHRNYALRYTRFNA